MTFQELVKENDGRAAVFLQEIQEGTLDDDIYEGLRGYVGCKFFLDDDEMTSDDLRELSELSLKKLLATYQEEALQDVSTTCTGVSSSSTKRILLIMSLQRKLGIKLPFEVSAKISTIRDLCTAISSEMRKRSEG